MLCWCCDNNEGKKYIEVVDKYESKTAYPFTTQREDFKYATPLTKQEIQVLLDNAPEGENG